MKVFIPSKDRASQLDLLLRSIEENLPNTDLCIRVLYKTSNEEFEKGYKKLIDKYDNTSPKNIYSLQFDKEFSFEDQFLDLISDNEYTKEPMVMLLTDDSVFYRKSELHNKHIDDLMDGDVWSFSFRLGLNTTTQWYKTGQQQEHLDILGYKLVNSYSLPSETCIKWNWKIRPPFENYGYMMSWDGHVYRSTDLHVIARKFTYYNPRTFEDKATKNISDRYLIHRKYMVAPVKSCLFVNTINAVQAEPPPFGDKYTCSAEELNERYLAGEIISMETFRDLELSGSHDEIPLEFEKE